MMRRRRPRARDPRRALARARACSARSVLGACGNTLQDQPIPHNDARGPAAGALPRLLARRLLPRHGDHRSLARTPAARSPSSTATAWKAARTLRHAPAGGHLARQQLRPGEARTPRAARLAARRRRLWRAQGDETIAIPTGGVVLDIYANSPALAPRRRRRRPCRSTTPALPARRCPRRCPTPASANAAARPDADPLRALS